jgi:hypothetical protein
VHGRPGRYFHRRKALERLATSHGCEITDMARASPKGPKAHPNKWTVVFSVKLKRFDTLQEAEDELKKAEERGERAYILPPLPRG